ncbi:hypothetical protein V144x_54810 [Gimesia aquarii]|uniref:HTTM domain-containing protein n=2 Tax=Gimesia aquarii TaxID=2527964 RepID=A0A517W3Y1_9PLAN|nr:hypothetical protein V144x_54810 [Gimesia aquarii]
MPPISILILVSIQLIVAYAIIVMAKRLGATYFDHFVGEASPEALGAIRFWIFMILAINVAWEDLPSVSHLPAQLRTKMGIMSLLHMIPEWGSVYASYTKLLVLKMVTLTFLVFAMLGFKTRLSVPCATILVLIHAGILREHFNYYHTGLVPILVGIALSFMPCGHGLSADQYFFRKKTTDAILPLAVYGWSRYLCWTVIASAYVMAGISKIRNGGFWWWHGANLKRIVMTDTLNPMHFEWGLEHEIASLPVFVFSALGISAVLAESLYSLVLFSKRARFVIPMLTAGMHLGILFFQGILFFDLILIQAVFYNLSECVPQAWRRKATLNQDPLSNTQQRSLHQKYFSVFLFMMLGLSICWLARVEFYPATAMQMYSNTQTDGSIIYKKIWAVYEDGHKEEARLEKWIGAVADSRYRFVLGKDSKAQQAFFDEILTIANRDSQKAKMIRFDVKTYQWNFLTDPNDSDFGRVIDIATYP